jgi:hypothetical protein
MSHYLKAGAVAIVAVFVFKRFVQPAIGVTLI